MGGVLALVLRRQEANCPVIRSIAQEILTCLVVQPLFKKACPGYVFKYIALYFILYSSIYYSEDDLNSVCISVRVCGVGKILLFTIDTS